MAEAWVELEPDQDQSLRRLMERVLGGLMTGAEAYWSADGQQETTTWVEVGIVCGW